MKPIQLDFKPSIVASLLFTTMSVGAIAIVMLLALYWQLKLLLSLSIIASVINVVLNHCLRLLPWSCISLRINNKNQLQLIYRDGKQLDVTVLENSVVTPYLTVLNYHCNEASFMQRLFTQHLIIFYDAVEVEGFRQLRVYLRWAKPPTASSGRVI